MGTDENVGFEGWGGVNETADGDAVQRPLANAQTSFVLAPHDNKQRRNGGARNRVDY